MPKSSLPEILDDALIERIAKEGKEDQYLILEEHPDFPGRWIVQCLNWMFIFDFEDLIGSYRAVSPAGLKPFLDRAKELGYKVAFGAEPGGILKPYESLNDEPEVAINSDFPGTVKGLLPYQVRGFNFLKDLEGGVVLWSTGTGKSVIAAALLKYHMQRPSFDFAFVLAKAHNTINMQRSLLRLADIDGVMLDGPKERRKETVSGLLEAPVGTVIITNYEKLRVDHQELLPLFEGRRILLIADELPTKTKNRNTKLYKSIRSLLYRKASLLEPRTKELRGYMLSATPIENDPEDFYNSIRLLRPEIFGSIKEFRDEYVASYSFFGNKPEKWQNLDKMGLKASHVVHEVDKNDPEIAKQFPKVVETPYYIDWHPEDRAVYNLLTKKARDDFDLFDSQNVLALISVMQMLCDAPSMVSKSAARREVYEMALEAFLGDPGGGGLPPQAKGSEVARLLQEALTRPLRDDNHTKLEILRSLLTEDHPNEKILVFSAFNEALMPILEERLIDWSVPFVRYTGTAKEKQIAQDYFQKDDTVRVFLSSDQGSDSLSLEEASVVIHYDLPWKWSTLTQRQNRVHRVTSEFGKVRYYTLMMADSVEERKLSIIKRKREYHDQVFGGAIAEQSESAKMTIEDLRYILLGSV